METEFPRSGIFPPSEMNRGSLVNWKAYNLLHMILSNSAAEG